MKQAAREWNKKIHTTLLQNGFKRLCSDAGIYVYRQQEGNSLIILIVILYVDDITLMTNHRDSLNQVKKALQKAYEMKDLGELDTFLGMKIIRNRKRKTIRFDQSDYITLVLERNGMLNCNPARTPFATGTSLTKNTNQSTDEERTEYQQIIGSIMYAAICSRPDIMYAIIKLSQFMTNPSKQHFVAAKHLLRYLSGTRNAYIKYGETIKDIEGFSDSDWAENKDDRHSTSGNCFIIAGAVVSWSSKKQTTVACSSVEAEYLALSDAVKQALWFKTFFYELKIDYVKNIKINLDSQGANQLATNPVHHKRTKHIDIRHHFIREHIEKKSIKLNHVASEDNSADGFTKALTPEKHKNFCNQIGVRFD